MTGVFIKRLEEVSDTVVLAESEGVEENVVKRRGRKPGNKQPVVTPDTRGDGSDNDISSDIVRSVAANNSSD